MRWLALTMVAVGSMGIGAAHDGTKEDLAKLQGTWLLKDREVAGKKATPREITELNIRFTLKGAKVLFVSLGEKEEQESTIKLDAMTTPKTIDITHATGIFAGKVVHGIYKLEGDLLTVCNSLKERPKEFSTAENADRVLLVFRREKQ